MVHIYFLFYTLFWYIYNNVREYERIQKSKCLWSRTYSRDTTLDKSDMGFDVILHICAITFLFFGCTMVAYCTFVCTSVFLVAYWLHIYAFVVLYFWRHIKLLESPIPPPPPTPSQKAHFDNISGTKRGSIDPLVSKRPEKNSE